MSMTAQPGLGLNASVALLTDDEFVDALPKKHALDYDANNGFPDTP